jgi:hypothetical protein
MVEFLGIIFGLDCIFLITSWLESSKLSIVAGLNSTILRYFNRLKALSSIEALWSSYRKNFGLIPFASSSIFKRRSENPFESSE